MRLKKSRGVAQLVARLVRDQEVVGSNPVTPTKKLTINLKVVFVGKMGDLWL